MFDGSIRNSSFAPPARAQDQSLWVRQRDRSGRVTGRAAEENLASTWLALQTDCSCPLCPSPPAPSATVRKSSFRAMVRRWPVSTPPELGSLIPGPGGERPLVFSRVGDMPLGRQRRAECGGREHTDLTPPQAPPACHLEQLPSPSLSSFIHKNTNGP